VYGKPCYNHRPYTWYNSSSIGGFPLNTYARTCIQILCCDWLVRLSYRVDHVTVLLGIAMNIFRVHGTRV